MVEVNARPGGRSQPQANPGPDPNSRPLNAEGDLAGLDDPARAVRLAEEKVAVAVDVLGQPLVDLIAEGHPYFTAKRVES